MTELAAQFEAMEFGRVATFIASGNVLFESDDADETRLETMIETRLAGALGYEVDTFVRTRAEVGVVAGAQPFPEKEMGDSANTIHVCLLKAPLSVESSRRLEACRTEVDEFRSHGREFYWLCRIRTSESIVWRLPEIKAVALKTSTMRNITMIRKLAAKFPAT